MLDSGDEVADTSFMSAGEAFEFNTEQWCAGLRCTGARPLTRPERELLVRHRVTLERRLWAHAAGILCGLLVPLALGFVLPTGWTRPWIQAASAGALAAVALLVPTILALRTRVAWHERRRLARDLRAGDVLCFEGALGLDEPIDEEQRRLFDAGYLLPAPGVSQLLEVLPESGMVFRPGPLGSLRRARVAVHEIAPGPGYALRVPVPEHVVRVEGAPDVRFARRSLNPAEQAELTAHIRRLRRPGWPIVLLGAWIATWAFGAAADYESMLAYARMRWPLVLIQGVVLAFALAAQLRALRLASHLERDIHTGWALTFDRNDGTTPAREAPAGTEFLPHSHVVWYANGKPARWRNLRRAA
jgi:hypothetical protein